MRRFLFLFSSFYIGNPKNCKHKKKYNIYIKNGPCQLKTWQNIKNIKKRKKKKYKNKNKMCRGGGGDQSSLFALISNTLPQLEQSSLHPQQFSVIASCYRPPATTISVFSFTSTDPVKKNRSSNRLGTPLAGG